MIKVTEQIGFAIQAAARPKIAMNQAWGLYPGGGLISRSLPINLGDPAPDRRVVVVISMCDGERRSFNGTPTLDGVPMTPLFEVGNSYQPSGVWIINRPDGATTGTLFFTANAGNMDGQAVVAMSLYGASQILPAFSIQPGKNAATIDWPGTKVLGVWFNWQSGTPVMPAPWDVLVNNLHTQGNTTVAMLDMDSAFNLPAWSAPYYWASFFAAWQA